MLVLLSLCIWLYLFIAHGSFWRSEPQLPPAAPAELPDVDIVIPARDEAATIGAVVGSLLAQDYAGLFRITLVDDQSTDATAAVAGESPRLTVIAGSAKPPGWSGKLWALSQGIDATSAPVLLLADADIVHDPRHLSSLVARLMRPRVELVSEMVRLNCESVAERLLIPAFVYFFQMLYPFSKVNDPHSSWAAACGGTVLLRRSTLALIGGIDVIKSTLIDDVALAKAVKRLGPIYLGHSGLATSIRPYPAAVDIWRMITRTAFTQLRYSSLLLMLTMLGLTLVWLVPVGAVLFVPGWPRAMGVATLTLAAVSYCPTLQRFGVSSAYSILLPLIAVFYMAATLGSALEHWFGSGARWKNRAYGSQR